MIADTVNQISSKWWTFLVRGIIALALAAFAFMEPSTMASALVYVFAAYFIISGIVSLIAGVSLTGVDHWWALILMGLVQGALGVIMLSQPGAGPLTLAFFFALYMVTTGVLEISSAIALRSYINNEFWWILLGITTLAFGFFVVIYPGIGVLALVYTVGFYGVLACIALIALAFRIKNVGSDLQKARATA